MGGFARRMKTRTFGFVSAGWLFALMAAPASAQVNYAVSGGTAYVAVQSERFR